MTTGLASTRHALMAELSSNSSQIDNSKKPTSMMSSPTSILDTLKNPFFSDPNPSTKSPDSDLRRTWDNGGIGLGIVGVLKDDNSGTNLPKPESRLVLFGSQLKIQVPTTESPKSPADFGIKTRNCNSQLGSSSNSLCCLSNSPVKKSFNSGMDTPTGCLSAIEMELSEDYTCVISYGPNPKTTHIFDDCVIESCCEIGSSFCTDSFLSFCYTCKKNLGHGKDIYIYRGEKAFCSRECRHQEMMLEEEMNKMDSNEDIYGAC